MPIAAVLTVLRAFREGGVTPTSNLVFFFDGEEEAGSRNLGRYMEMQAGKLDGIDPIGDEEQAALESIPDVDPQLRRELGLAWTEGQPETIAERLLLPALNVRGITSGNTGALARHVIPDTAVAALGIRLVKGNDPAHLRQLVVNHIEAQGFHVVSEDPDIETRPRYPRIARVTGGGGYPAARTGMADPFVQQVIGAASDAADLAFGPGSLVLAPGTGGTLPVDGGVS